MAKVTLKKNSAMLLKFSTPLICRGSGQFIENLQHHLRKMYQYCLSFIQINK